VSVSPRDDAWSAVKRMAEAHVPRLVVVDEVGRLVGTLDGHDLQQAVALHQQATAERQREGRPRWPQERENPV
jgi:CBS-domain-containing membrane protein